MSKTSETTPFISCKGTGNASVGTSQIEALTHGPVITVIRASSEQECTSSNLDPSEAESDCSLSNYGTMAKSRTHGPPQTQPGLLAMDWWKMLSPTLENNGSVARDHLASERTFLAYVRTSLAISASGVALIQLFTIAANNGGFADPSNTLNLNHSVRCLAVATVVVGIMILIIGTTRFFAVQFALVKGNFPIARMAVACLSTVLLALIIFTFGVIFSAKLTRI